MDGQQGTARGCERGHHGEGVDVTQDRGRGRVYGVYRGRILPVNTGSPGAASDRGRLGGGQRQGGLHLRDEGAESQR